MNLPGPSVRRLGSVTPVWSCGYLPTSGKNMELVQGMLPHAAGLGPATLGQLLRLLTRPSQVGW